MKKKKPRRYWVLIDSYRSRIVGETKTECIAALDNLRHFDEELRKKYQIIRVEELKRKEKM